MQIGMIGLGRMGLNMAQRLLNDKHEVVAYNRTAEKVKQLEKAGAVGAGTIEELIKKLKAPRLVWLMLPAGNVTDDHVNKAAALLETGDIIIDGGNSFYKDDIRRAGQLAEKGINYLDAGVSGGIWGLKNGYCTMIGGDQKIFEHIEPILKTLAPKDGYLYCGQAGAGHFVKMIHNGIEYAMMEAYGEGFEILKSSPYETGLEFDKVAHLWNQGSVVRSWLLELLEDAFTRDPGLEKISGFVEDSGEGRWTVQQAVESGVAASTITQALFKRFESRQKDLFSNKVLAALRNEFGGHTVKTK